MTTIMTWGGSMGALMPTRLRNALSQMSSGQRKAIRLPHVGAKEIAKHDAREKAAHRKWINSVEAEITERKEQYRHV